MTAVFNKKPLNAHKRVCVCLKEIREKKKISLKEVTEKTKLCGKYLQALEECRFSDLPNGIVYQKNYIKQYARAINEDPAVFLARFEEEEKEIKKNPHPLSGPRVKKRKVINFCWFTKPIAALALISVFLFYFGWQVKQIINPPFLFLQSPEDGMITSEGKINIAGQTEKEAEVFINGKPIPHQETGEFNQEITLNPGVNTLMISAEKKSGKKSATVRHVIFQATEQISFHSQSLTQ